jgi:hypothetical protein
MSDLMIDEGSVKYEVRDKIRVQNFVVDVPSKYRGKGLTTLLPVSTKKISQLINCPGVESAEVFFGKSLLCVTLFDFSQSPVGPYTELVFSTPVSYKSKIKLPLISLLKDEISKKFNLYIIDIAQSTKIAIEHGNLLTGYPHNQNLINVAFEERGKNVNAKAYGDDGDIISIQIEKPEKERIFKENYFTYFEKDGNPFKIQMDIYGIGGNVKINELNIGRHKLAEIVRNLDAVCRPLSTRYARDVIEINPVTREEL